MMSFCKNQILLVLLLVSGPVIGSCSDLCTGSGSCSTPVRGEDNGNHRCDHGHNHHHDGHGHQHKETKNLLPEELAEEEDMRLYGFGPYHHHDHDHADHPQLFGLGLWLHALGCSLLVSLASLICLIILPVIFIQGKPSKAIVDSLALFGAGAMLGDAFLHQLPHAFGGEHSHSHDHHEHHAHQVQSGHEHQLSHSHSLKDLSVGISVLAGIVIFLLVEKVVRYVEENSSEANSWGHGHHHHHHKSSKKLKDDNDVHAEKQPESSSGTEEKVSNEISEDSLDGVKPTQSESHIRKRKTSSAGRDDKLNVDAVDGSFSDLKSLERVDPAQSSNLVFGYLNLFSDGVHNFTDGIALGSAFLLYGSVGGWSRTLFLLAHELPQEIGDFGILVRSGFSVSKALLFNFLSALMALVGTAMALLLGQDPGQSSLIEGFTAGGFIYIAVAGVLAEMNDNGSSTLKSTAVQLTSLIMGMAVALCISLVE
ncbi:hypothetical protein LWI28_001046 [Acer negundo]|uniref:IAA-alanine resistance protein 1 n=1 Tax=Acer negundo TaxID=4023 RepID=A0AAD5NL05_ACENE|nr:hypothetical protein LWI28_001046 [Acer negundo]KAK4842754.1 hypothetical protein QYF36_027144 [Acer negundo]